MSMASISTQAHFSPPCKSSRIRWRRSSHRALNTRARVSYTVSMPHLTSIILDAL